MSVDLSKLNRPGMASSFGSASKARSGISSQATKNLANSSAANRTSLFSLKSGPKTNWVPGQQVSRDTSKYNYQGIRQRLNSGQVRKSGFYGTPSTARVATNTNFTIDNNSAYQKGMVAGQIISGAFSMLNKFGVFDSLKADNSAPTSNSRTLDAAMNSLGGISTASTVSSSAASSAIASMSGATDSASLRSAIADASNQLTSMDAQTGALETQAYNAEQNKATLESNVKEAKEDVKTKKQNLSNANNAVDIKTKNRDSKKLALENANSAYGKASAEYSKTQQAHTQAKAAVASAEQNLASAESALSALTPRTAENAVQHDAAKKAVETAKEKLNNAREEERKAADAENKAKVAKDKAYQEVGNAKTAVDKADKELETAEKELDEAKKKQTEAEKALKESEGKLEKAEHELQSAEGAIEKFKQHQEDIKDLQKAIEKEQKRLTKLEEKEQDKYADLTDSINAGAAKNEKRDERFEKGNVIFEKRLSKKMENTNQQMREDLAEKNALHGNVNDTQYIKETLMKQPPDKTIGNMQFRKGVTPSGQEVYYRDSLPISKEEYEKFVNM